MTVFKIGCAVLAVLTIIGVVVLAILSFFIPEVYESVKVAIGLIVVVFGDIFLGWK